MNVEISRICPNQETVLGNRGCLKVLTITYKSRLTQLTPKQLYKKRDDILASMGETGLCHDFFLNFHLGLSRSLRLNDNRPLNSEAATSKFGNHVIKNLDGSGFSHPNFLDSSSFYHQTFFTVVF